MTTTVLSVDPETDAEAAWAQMRKARIRHLLVMEGSLLLGVISDRDLRGAGARSGRAVRELMTPHVVCVAPESSVRRAAQLLRSAKIGCVPVIDGKRVVGIVTTTDVLKIVTREHEPRAPGKARGGRPSPRPSRAVRA